MKLFYIILIFTFTQFAYSQSCDPAFKDEQIKRIKLIESTILKRSLECDETDETVVCDFESAKQEYNKALAKLVLAQGIEALKSDITSSQESILGLTTKDLKSAFNSINKFEDSLLKANSLQKALVSGDDGRIFDSYFDSDLGVEEFTKKKCETNKYEFCSTLEGQNEDQKKKSYAFLENFLDTYFVLDPDQRDQDRYFKSISENLNINVGDQEQSVDVYQGTVRYKLIEQLKKKLQLFAVSKNDNDASEIASIVNRLKDEKIKLKNNTAISNEVDSLVKKDIQNNMDSLSNTYAILTQTDNVNEDITNTLKLIKEQTEKSINSLESDIKESFSKECEGLETSGCIRELQDSKYDNEPGVKLIRARFKRIIETDKYTEVLNASKACLDKEESKPAKARCIENIILNSKLKINNDINELKKDLKEKESLVAKFSKSPHVAQLEKEKVIALSYLKENNCLEDSSIVLNCNNFDIQDYNKAMIKLTSDSRDLLVAFDIQEFKKLTTKKITPIEGNDNTTNEEVIVNEKTENKTKTVEKKVFTAKEKRLNRKIEKYNRKRQEKFRKMSINKSKTSSSSGGGAAFFQSFTSSMMMGVPQILHQARQRQQIRAEAQYRREYYNWQINNLKNYNNGYYNYGGGLNMNWGANAYNPYNASNFNGSNPYLYYNNSYNYTQYTYGADNIGNTYYNSGQNLTAPASSSGQNASPFSFSF